MSFPRMTSSSHTAHSEKDCDGGGLLNLGLIMSQTSDGLRPSRASMHMHLRGPL